MVLAAGLVIKLFKTVQDDYDMNPSDNDGSSNRLKNNQNEQFMSTPADMLAANRKLPHDSEA